MTNGEMIKAIFPSAEIDIGNGGNDIWIAIDCWTIFKKEWWDAEYKEPTTKNDLGVDAISRADARKAIIDHQYSDSFCVEHNIDHSINTGMALIALSDLPPATPQEPKRGQWISRWYAGHNLHFHVCSECNEEFSCDMETGISIDNYRYCPNCGAKMEGEE